MAGHARPRGGRRAGGPLALLLLLLPAFHAHQLQGWECQEATRCQSVERRPVCGSDGVTYQSQCHLDVAVRCGNRGLTAKHQGRCKRAARKSCWADREAALGAGAAAFVPACLADGSYAPVQCHGGSGFCWCVTPLGQLVPRSTAHGQPRCNKKSNTRRRSSNGGRRQKKGCSRNERSTLNNNLMKSFKLEFNRSAMSAEGGGAVDDSRVLAWKFSSLDRDNDTFLSRAESAQLRRMVRKVKPKRCAKDFLRTCDLDSDRRLSAQEWSACLTIDVNLSSLLFTSLTSEEDPLQAVSKSSAPLVLWGMPAQPSLDGSDEMKPETDGNDCISDRNAVLEEQKTANNTELYVPECTPEGHFQKIQCFKSTGYCWCVNEDNGKPIPGTSAKNSTPNCDAVPPPSRPMIGCPEPKKRAFLQELMVLLQKQAGAHSTNSSESSQPDVPWQMSSTERVLNWNFNNMDYNKNKLLERKEWKSFRTMLTANAQLRRCGKRLLRYCDVNHDQKISLTEWLSCLNIQRSTSAISEAANPMKRTGKNPLETLLKDE